MKIELTKQKIVIIVSLASAIALLGIHLILIRC